MLTALTAPVRYSVTERRLVTAFGISVAAHLVLFGFVRLAPAMASRMFAPVIAAVMPARSAAALKAEEARKALEAKKEAERQARKEAQQPALTFVDVDPALAVLDAPKTPKYYSSKSTVAANPDFQKTTAAPKLDGNQVHVPRLADVPRVQPKPLQPSPRPEPPEESARPVPETPAPKPAPAPPAARRARGRLGDGSPRRAHPAG